MPLAFGCATVVLLVGTLLPLAPSDHWMVRGFDFPRLQLLLAALGALGGALLLLDRSAFSTRLVLVGLGVVIAWQSWWILPYTPIFPREVLSAPATDDDRGLRILNANVLTPNREAGRLLALVRQHAPDLVITLESDTWWERQLDTLAEDYPFAVKHPLDNLYGMHLYSRLELREVSVEFLVEPDKPSIHAHVVLRSGEVVRLHVLHPAPPSPTENEESTPRDRELVVVARRVAREGVPAIVAGDLNDVAWSHTTRAFRRISGMLDPRVGRGMFNTYHAGHWFMRWPLDHVFHTDEFTVRRIERLPGIGSDHFPLLSELHFEPAAAAEQEGLDATDG
ncbi:MAG: endonuclease/exonuclease/phosphatase family protein [Gemmatimonadales bacterium]